MFNAYNLSLRACMCMYHRLEVTSSQDCLKSIYQLSINILIILKYPQSCLPFHGFKPHLPLSFQYSLLLEFTVSMCLYINDVHV